MFECLRYRAPEVLLQSSAYDSAVGMKNKNKKLTICLLFVYSWMDQLNSESDVSSPYHLIDMWAMGAIMAELLTLHPLFPGTR